jgi:betaine-homocysteine S-methyltransferase
MYEEQLSWAVDEGIDFVIAETNDYLGEALIALEVIKQLKFPAMVTLASTRPHQTWDGYDYVDACKILADHGADIVGMNCDRGPATMLPIIEQVRSRVTGYVAMQPVPYKTDAAMPTFESLKTADGTNVFPIALEPFLCTRFEMADYARRAQALGVNYIGICCGGSPHYVRAIAEALGRTVPSSKYSPAIELHPVIGTRVEEKEKEFLVDWKG